MSPVFSLKGIEKRHHGHLALSIDRLDLHPGRVYSLVGPNGAGKSTLLQILALLTPPCEGTLHFAGEEVLWKERALKKGRNRVTLVHQSPYLFDRSVERNLAFGLELRGIRGALQQRRIAEALEAVELAGFEGRQARELSGGEAQRVALARALALEPEVLLLDEPTASMHRETVPVLEKLIGDLRRRGTTVVISTHDPDQPRRLKSEIIRLEKGRIKNTAVSPQPSAPPKLAWGESLPLAQC